MASSRSATAQPGEDRATTWTGGGRMGEFYDVPRKLDVETSNVVIIGIILVCHRHVCVLFDYSIYMCLFIFLNQRISH